MRAQRTPPSRRLHRITETLRRSYADSERERGIIVRILVIPFAIVVVLLVIALVLPSKGDTSVATWWARVRYQGNVFVRAALALACLAAIVWFILLPLFGWTSIGR